jgi:hypothetical protein
MRQEQGHPQLLALKAVLGRQLYNLVLSIEFSLKNFGK